MIINRPTERLTIHRMEILDHKLTKIPTEDGLGAIYKYKIIQRDETSVWIRGWSTGRECGAGDIDGADWQQTPIGRIYAPQGFYVGKRAIVECDDPMMRLKPKECDSVSSFLEGLEHSESIGTLLEKIQGFSFIGEILPPAVTRDGRVFSETYFFPEELSKAC
ncbi:MAG: hypothetical protein AABX30_01025 [Nanoarchaeota archaeon]